MSTIVAVIITIAVCFVIGVFVLAYVLDGTKTRLVSSGVRASSASSPGGSAPSQRLPE
jgi:hypothetical protein